MNKVVVNVDKNFEKQVNETRNHVFDVLRYGLQFEDVSMINMRPRVKSIDFYVDPEQRATVCIVTTKTGNKFFGIAKCHPNDTFLIGLGRKYALTDAIKNMNKPSRKMVWDYYIKKWKEGK